MRIHTNTLTMRDLYDAAGIARVTFGGDTPTSHGSRSRDHAFNVLLRGESNRRPNMGTADVYRFDNPEFAATWDQWGVFLAVLFDKDPAMHTPYDKDRDAFHYRTKDRFRGRSVVGQTRTFIDIPQGETVDYWPTDAHGDHTFRYSGTPYQQECTKCSAVQRWERRAA